VTGAVQSILLLSLRGRRRGKEKNEKWQSGNGKKKKKDQASGKEEVFTERLKPVR